ncbi:MAG: hypothetical protein NT088_01835 [Candidatus Omnitrophica bacterium]|nr:hypothetical protein [Candidatus Omnitrophota bacterium]
MKKVLLFLALASILCFTYTQAQTVNAQDNSASAPAVQSQAQPAPAQTAAPAVTAAPVVTSAPAVTPMPTLTPTQKKVAVAVAAAAVLAMMFVVLVLYIYSSICIMFIAKKTAKTPAWLAWIPIGNLFLLCKVAGISYWWLLLLLVYIVPIAGPLIFLAFCGYLWYKVALARNKPGWVGILWVIPIVNLVVMGYLAFSE